MPVHVLVVNAFGIDLFCADGTDQDRPFLQMSSFYVDLQTCFLHLLVAFGATNQIHHSVGSRRAGFFGPLGMGGPGLVVGAPRVERRWFGFNSFDNIFLSIRHTFYGIDGGGGEKGDGPSAESRLLRSDGFLGT